LKMVGWNKKRVSHKSLFGVDRRNPPEIIGGANINNGIQ